MVNLKPFFLSLIVVNVNFINTIEINKRIHIFGDSHSSFSFTNSGKAPSLKETFTWYLNNIGYLFCINYLVDVTMHRLGRDNISILDFRKYDIQNGDIIVFAFGEIDVRYNIGKQRDHKKRELEEIIDTLVDNYFKTILMNFNMFTDLHCIIFNVLPPSNKAYKPYGTLLDRIIITKKLNIRLRDECSKYNFQFLDVTDYFSTNYGDLNPALSDGSVHINPNKNALVKIELLKLIYQQ